VSLNWSNPALKPILALAGVGLVAVIVSGVYARSCYLAKVDAAAIVQADGAHESAVTHAAQGATYDQQATAQAPVIQAAEAKVERLRGELARLRKSAPKAPSLPDAPTIPEPQPVVPPVDLAPLVAKQDELIQAQDKQIGDLKSNVITLAAARDSWRQSAGDFQREAVSLRIAHEAQLSAIKASRWKGRIEGFAVGLATGYTVGRLNGNR